MNKIFKWSLSLAVAFIVSYSLQLDAQFIATDAAMKCGCCASGEATSPIIMALDIDKDGVISAVEIRNAAQSLAALDSDGDGKLSRNETHVLDDKKKTTKVSTKKPEKRKTYPFIGGYTNEYFADVMLAKFDADDNGQLEFKEMPSTVVAILPRVDADSDKILTRKELIQLNRRIRTPVPEEGNLRR